MSLCCRLRSMRVCSSPERRCASRRAPASVDDAASRTSPPGSRQRAISASSSGRLRHLQREGRQARGGFAPPIEELQRRVHGLQRATDVEQLGRLEDAALLGERERRGDVGAAAEGWHGVLVEQRPRLARLAESDAHGLLAGLEETGRLAFREQPGSERRAATRVQRGGDSLPLEALESGRGDFEGHPADSRRPSGRPPRAVVFSWAGKGRNA